VDFRKLDQLFGDYCLFGEPVFPVASFLEMIVAVQLKSSNSELVNELHDIEIAEPFSLHSSSTKFACEFSKGIGQQTICEGNDCSDNKPLCTVGWASSSIDDSCRLKIPVDELHKHIESY
jgi:hypothetical protein